MNQKKILIADVTGHRINVKNQVVKTITLKRDADPQVFTPYDTIFLTGFVDSLPFEVARVTDFINASGYNPLMGKNRDELGPRFPDMSFVFSFPESCDLPGVIVTAGDVQDSGLKEKFIRCDAMVWNAILGAHQKKKIYGILYKSPDVLQKLIRGEMRIISA
jgi:hypothetical protein